jgi:hypothetical protein
MNDLLKRMPKGYRDINWRVYVDLLNNVMVCPENMDEEDFKSYQAFSMISILINVPISELDALPFATMISLINALTFMNEPISITHSNINVKELEKLTYKEFQSLVQLLPDQYNNMDDILEIIIDDDTVDIDKLNIWEVMQIMGKLTNISRTYLRRSQVSMAWKIIVMKMKTMLRIKKDTI